jgi:hypothetical protein
MYTISIYKYICIVNVYMHIIELQSASKMVFEVAQDLRRTKNNASCWMWKSRLNHDKK